MSEYRELLERLLVARRFGMKLGLERMRELLDRLGAPDRQLGEVVHVAGTNGKGSTVVMLAALVRACGKRVATYTSPHLSTLRERITIDGELVSEAAIVGAAARVEAAGGSELTFFEQVTAIAMLIIADAKVDVTVLEVGLGGRLDATNVVDAKVAPVAVITGIAMDHEAILGNTLEAIAAEKAGIVKPGQRVVIGAAGEPAVVPVLVKLAHTASAARVTVIDDSAIARVPPVALLGTHQRANAACALRALDELEMACDAASVLSHVTHPGRFEQVGDYILDGAHNPHGARALATTLREQGMSPVMIIAVSADKDVRAIAEALAPCVSAVIATRYQQERSLAPDDLAATFRAIPRLQAPDAQLSITPAPSRSPGELLVESAPDLASALARARQIAAEGPRAAPILVAGSLFLVGEARVLLLGAPTDPIFISDPVRAPR